MNDFDYDCLQKKRIAGQAKYRKRGSKSKKCTLPSDKLTQKQWEERCGPVLTYNLNRPMKWSEFKKLPTRIQTEYIASLQDKYGVTAVDLGDMFGVKALAVRRHVDANSLGITFPRGHTMSAAHRVEWEKFLSENVSDSETINTVESVPAETDAVPKAEFGGEQYKTGVIAPPKGMNMKKFSLQFSGMVDVDMIANSLKLLLGNQANGELEIICNLA